MITRKEIQTILKLAEAATKGPWIGDNGEGYSPWTIWSGMTPSGYGNRPGTLIAQVVGDSAETYANAAFIAHSRIDVPALANALIDAMEMLKFLSDCNKQAECQSCKYVANADLCNSKFLAARELVQAFEGGKE